MTKGSKLSLGFHLNFISGSDLDSIDHFTFGFHLLFNDSHLILIPVHVFECFSPLNLNSYF